jgi:poly-gamma-glutamate synthesis protein (capsule biosynthesis protein)
MFGIAVPAHAADWNLTFVGDIMLDRNVRTEIRSKGFEPLVAKIRSEFTGDAVIANLEGPFTNSTKHAVPGGSLLFTFEPYLAKKLRAAGITTVSLANNHTLNQGYAGLAYTRTTLKNAGIEYFGDPVNRHAYRLVQQINGTRIAYVGHHGLVSGLDTILKDIRSAKTFADVVIVFAHEGTEYQLNFTKRQQQDYRKMIDAGATMVIGAHPHVVEPIEIYKGKFIAYSLGNFLFDQYFSADTQQGLLLHISGTGSTPTSVQFVPIQSQRSVVRPASPTIRTNILRRISQNSVANASIKSQLKTGTIRLSQ